MKVLTDSGGLAISTKSPAAAASYVRGVALLVAPNADAASALRVAVALDPGFALAWIALAFALADTGTELGGEVEQGVLSAAANAASTSRRERQHLEVIRLVLSGDRHRAAVLGREHLLEYPTDRVVAHAIASRGLR